MNNVTIKKMYKRIIQKRTDKRSITKIADRRIIIKRIICEYELMRGILTESGSRMLSSFQLHMNSDINGMKIPISQCRDITIDLFDAYKEECYYTLYGYEDYIS